MKEQGVTKVYILNDKEAYGLGVATTTRKAAEHLGIEVVGFEAWDPKAASYESLFKKIKATGADAVFLGGLIDENGAQVIKDKVAVLGPNDGDVKLFAPDGFTTQQTITDAGPASAGMFMSVAGVPIDEFTGVAEEFATSFEADYLNGARIDPYAIYGAQAAQILLDAIEDSDGTRSDVIAKMFETRGHGRPARLVQVQRERRPGGRVRCGRRLHDLRRDRQARDGGGHLAEPGGRGGCRRGLAATSTSCVEAAGGHCPPAAFRFRVARHGVRARPASRFVVGRQDRARARRARRPLAPRQLRQGAGRVHQRRADRPDERRDLRRRRARLHARLRDPPADQLRPRRRVRAVRALREHGHRLGARPRHRLERARHHRRAAPDVRRRDGRRSRSSTRRSSASRTSRSATPLASRR